VWTRAQTALLTVLSEAKLSEALIPGRYPHVKLEEAVTTNNNNSGPTNGDESTVAK
ncbi:MAG: hypothetical protein HKN21_17805, partial [Candidatus Eisenbacteria bacterium]|nr:hypothetical protein [Candidatus Eisenbacteria bacterium]